MKISKSKHIVESLMKVKPHLRDDDNKLLASVWFIQCKEMGFDPMKRNANDFFYLIAEKKLANAESVRRSRAKLQELHPEYRGKIYVERHKEKEVVKNDLKTF